MTYNINDIFKICKKYNIEKFTINSDGSINVNESVYLFSYNLDKLPLNFNIINGNFDCSFNMLTSLDGFPKTINGNFDCSNNKITSLYGFPNIIGKYIDCSNNKITSLKYLNNEICTIIDLLNNPLESIDGYNGNYNLIRCDNKRNLILKLERKSKLKNIMRHEY